jgi:hypothetical protein
MAGIDHPRRLLADLRELIRSRKTNAQPELSGQPRKFLTRKKTSRKSTYLAGC